MIKPAVVLELGTSLGISTMYLAKGAPESHVNTVEGDPALVSIAQKTFEDFNLTNIKLFNQPFEEFIEKELPKIKTIDFVFLDGNHNSSALLFYFDSLKPFFHNNTIVMVDDIYWSEDMHHGWETLIKLPEVTQSVDCFHFGLLFLSPDFVSKENHIIRLPLKALKPA